MRPDESVSSGETEEQIRAGRLWAGGAATAVVAALVAVVGILIARGVLNVPVLAPRTDGLWGNVSTLTYALVSAAAALGATGLLHLLLLSAPRPILFFGWIMVLITAIAVVLPLTLTVPLDSQIATAIINLAIGLAITMTLAGVARTITRPPSTSYGPAELDM